MRPSSPGNLSLRPLERVCQVVRRLRLAFADAGRVTMITETITKVAIQILDTSGYAGACALMTLESMIAPVPSEAVMPFVGFQVADGKWNLWLAIGSTSLGSIIGSLLSYWIGCFGGK